MSWGISTRIRRRKNLVKAIFYRAIERKNIGQYPPKGISQDEVWKPLLTAMFPPGT
jgi:hypothetical protein